MLEWFLSLFIKKPQIEKVSCKDCLYSAQYDCSTIDEITKEITESYTWRCRQFDFKLNNFNPCVRYRWDKLNG